MTFDLTRTCRQHAKRFDCPDMLIAQMKGGYGITVHDGGSSVIQIAFCPWCGTKLPEMHYPVEDEDGDEGEPDG